MVARSQLEQPEEAKRQLALEMVDSNDHREAGRPTPVTDVGTCKIPVTPSPASSTPSSPQRPFILAQPDRLEIRGLPAESESSDEEEEEEDESTPRDGDFDELEQLFYQLPESARHRAARQAARQRQWERRGSTVGGERWKDASIDTYREKPRSPLAIPSPRDVTAGMGGGVLAVFAAARLLHRARVKQAARKAKMGPRLKLTERGGVVPLKWLKEIKTPEEKPVDEHKIFKSYLQLQTTPEESLAVSRFESLMLNAPLWMVAPLLVVIYFGFKLQWSLTTMHVGEEL
jgi:hypothetical protein